MLSIPKSIVSSAGSASASSTTDWPDWRRGRRGSVALRLEAAMERLRELERSGPEEPAALPLVGVRDRHSQEVAGAAADVADRRRPRQGRGQRIAKEVIAIRRRVARARREAAVRGGALATDVDLRYRGEARAPRAVLEDLDR